MLLCFLTIWGQMQANDDLVEARVEHILSQMTIKEKIDYIGGHNAFYIRAINRLKIPEISIADGPSGVRKDGTSTAYPAGVNVASSFNVALAHEMGKMMGADARARGVHILLAPGINIARSPLCGRNFEYLGEDPYLTSRMAVNLISGIQSQNVVACIKHFVANEQEWNRHHVSSDLDERTLREIYLPPFEAAVTEARVGCVMAGYNLVNGVQMTQNRALNIDLLKNEWGFNGILISDWEATHDGIEAANSGLDLEMPYAAYMNRETLFSAIQSGKVSVETINDKVRRILRVLITFGFLDSSQTEFRDSLFNHKGQQIARTMAQESMVLLKNEAVLPLDQQKIKSIAVIGPCALTAIPRGGGSSDLTAHPHASYLGAISDFVGEDCDIYYAKGVPDLHSPKVTTSPEGRETGFIGQYFDNIDLSGSPALTRHDPAIKFKFKEKSYRNGGPVNHYSARWTGYYSAEKSGDHTFYLSGAGGFRLFVNDIPLIEKSSSLFEHKTLPLQEGKQYKICVEYFVEHGPQGIEFGLSHGKNRSIEQACEAAASSDIALIFAGFGHEYEGEDWDRTLTLPLDQDSLIAEVAAVNPRTIVIMSAGGNVDMKRWLGQVKGLLYAWYPGQEGQNALVDILFGKVSPSGKLPVTFEKRPQDSATYSSYHDKDGSRRVAYSEGTFIGYRHHIKNRIEPLFAFGFGLSYTTFSYANLAVVAKTVSFDITNTGSKAGAEVAQVYVDKALKGFTKVFLNPKETKRVTVTLDERAFSYYDVPSKAWKEKETESEIAVGSSSYHIHLVTNRAV